jgi:hypothetical protein
MNDGEKVQSNKPVNRDRKLPPEEYKWTPGHFTPKARDVKEIHSSRF